MNGNHNLFDTNALIEFFNGNLSLKQIYEDSEKIAISIISKIEFLSYPRMTKEALSLFEKFSEDCIVFGIVKEDTALIKLTSELQKKYFIKLPDALIASHAIINDYNLVSSDNGFKKILELTLIDFNEKPVI